MRKLARAGSGLAIAATLILSACGQARHISPAPRTTPTTPTPATMPRTLSVDEAAALIGRTVKQIAYLAFDGGNQAVRHGGNP